MLVMRVEIIMMMMMMVMRVEIIMMMMMMMIVMKTVHDAVDDDGSIYHDG